MSKKTITIFLASSEELESKQHAITDNKPSTEWPPDFFEKTAGCLADDPIERAPQGEYEIRKEK